MLIYGVGGSGKTSYLYMLENVSKEQNIPIAFVACRGLDGIRSAVDILREWARALNRQDVILPNFDKTLLKYDAVRSKIEQTEQENVFQDVDRKILEKLKKDEIRLLVDSSSVLTNKFLLDLSKVANEARVVLMLDDFETLRAEHNWFAGFASRISKNSLLIIAGRDLPDWDTVWDEWKKIVYIQELDGMADQDARTLLRQISGTSDLKMEDAIISSGANLPLVIALACDAYMQGADLSEANSQIVELTVDRFLRYVPEETIVVLEAAATIRKLDKDLLQDLVNISAFDKLYDALTQYSFIREKDGNFELHKTIREYLEKYLRQKDINRFVELHKKAASYFETKSSYTKGDEKWGFVLEALYHHVYADEKNGIQFCEEIAEDLVRYRRIDRLKTLLNEANNYPLQNEQSLLWRNYFNIRLKQLASKLHDSNWLEEILNDEAEPAIGDFMKDKIDYDIFISHAHEDKPFARDLANALKKRRLRVWYDEFTLSVGDKLRRSIDYGLANSRYGVVILSPHFFAKEWPQKELDGLVSRETTENKILLPIWHNITADEVRKYSPTLADRIAANSEKGIEHVISELLRAIK